MGNAVNSKSNRNDDNMININVPPLEPKQKEELSVRFKINVAIDFGTDGCAIAYYYNGKVTIYNKWMTKSRQRTTKVKTQILLNDQDEVVAFGDNAKIIYSSLSGNERRKWKFFDRFKMSLYENGIKNQEEQKASNGTIENPKPVKNGSFYVKSMNGTKCKPDIVFRSAFKHLQSIALKYMDKITNHKVIQPREIQWIMTVPAIWSEKAKYQMKQWMIDAGLVGKNIRDQCLIVYESDCAALAMFQEMRGHINQQKIDEEKQSFSNLFVKGNSYILIDAGGGTVDIASHKIVSKNAVEEFHYPTGNKYGSCYIDDEYMILLQDIFSKKWMDEFQLLAPNTYLEIIDCFQTAKKKFYKKKNAQYNNVELPYDFVQFLRKKCSQNNINIETKLKQYDQRSGSIMLEEELLIIGVQIWKKMFDKFIDPITRCVEKLLNKSKASGCQFITLVGGFSCSKYFRYRIKSSFGASSDYKLTIKTLKKPSLSVVTGAAYFGACHQTKKDFIQARIMKYTYGIGVNITLQQAYTAGISSEYIKKNKCINSMSNDVLVTKYFKILAKKNQRISLNDQPKMCETKSDGLTDSYIPVLCSNRTNPKTQNDGEILGWFLVPKWLNKNVVVEFHFYGTMFTVSWRDKKDRSKKRRQKLQINYGK